MPIDGIIDTIFAFGNSGNVKGQLGGYCKQLLISDVPIITGLDRVNGLL